MFARTACSLVALLGIALPLAAQNRQLFVLPPGDGSTAVSILNPDNLNTVATVQAANDAYKVLRQPGVPGKSYIVGRSSAATLTVVNAANNVLTTIPIPSGSSDAVMTPDGRRILLVSTSSPQLTVVDTASDAVTLTLPIASGAQSVVLNFDGTRAFTLSQAGALVTAFDLQNFQQAGTLILPSEVTQLSALSFGPNGLLYATTVNRLFEIDPRTVQLAKPLGLPYTGNPGGPALVTQDGTRAIMANATPIFGGSSVLLFDLSGTTIPQAVNLSGINITQLQLLSNNSAIGYSQASNAFYQFVWNPLGSGTLTIAGLPAINPGQTLRGLAVTNEYPTSRFGYLAFENGVYRFDAQTNSVVSQGVIAGPTGRLAYVTQPTSNTPANLQAINASQFVLPGTNSLPLVVRVLDAGGLPVAGVRVNYTTNQSNAVLNTAQATTNNDGYAQAWVTVPNQTVNFPVIASIDGGFTQVFTLLVNSSNQPGGGTGGTGAVSVAGGNGQLVLSRTPSLKPLQVRVRDNQGNPVFGATVSWTITNGGGSLTVTESTTDANGIASTNFIGQLLLSTLSSFATSTVAANTSLGSVNFTVITIPERASNDPFRPNGRPIIRQQVPNPGTVELSGALGTTIKGAFQFQIVAGGGPFLLGPIPGVGISAIAEDVERGPQVVCDGDPLSDNTGTVTCDLKLLTRTGTGKILVTIGGTEQFTFSVTITPGAPGRVTALQGNNQRGVAGRQLPQALIARVDDGFGNLLNGVEVTWRVVSGNATLVQTVNRSSNGLIINASGQGELSSGLVSTGVVLGSSPGDTRIRAQVSSTVFADFTVTTDVAYGGLTRVSGDGQSAAFNTAFADPLVVRVTDQNAQPLAGATVNFSTTGDLRLSSATATTDSQGLARITATAGPTAGSYQVSATISGSTLSPAVFSLTVRPPGPNITSIVNGAGFANTGVAPCGIATINGTNLAPGVTGTLSGQSLLGTLALTLNNTTVTFGGVTAPIVSIINLNGVEQINVQVPCDAVPGTSPVTVRTGTTSGNFNATIRQTAPGIFETIEGSLKYAVAQRPNGSFISPTNPALRGERVRVTVSNLGQTSPAALTNVSGTPGQRAIAEIVVGLNNEGVEVVSAEYAVGQNGLYIITFTIPANSPTGSRPLVVASTGSDGQTLYSNNSVIEVR